MRRRPVLSIVIRRDGPLCLCEASFSAPSSGLWRAWPRLNPMRATKALALVALAGAALIASIEARGSADTGASGQDPRAAIFIQRGCPECHAIAVLDVKAATDVGPD